jgi:hypothetical protein
VFENKLGRRIYGTKGVEVAGGWRKLYNKVPNNLYTSPNIVREGEVGGM